MGLINVEYFKKVSLNNSAFSLEIIERFLTQSEEYQNDLESAITSSDFAGVKTVMQQLKSQAQVFGANHLVDKIRRIEKAHSDRFDKYKEHILDTKSTFEDFIDEVNSMKQLFG
ncbi:MAG: Hpt domain-containing protein [Flammeovirgaceae bacterium]